MALTSALPSLPAREAGPVRRLLDRDAALVHELADGLAGPLHLLFPEAFDAAAAGFEAALHDTGVTGEIYFAKKANKAACWGERCAELGLGVDVASAAELRAALGAGVRGERMVVTGPAKPAELLHLAVHHGALITVDALDELERVAGLSGPREVPRLLLRCRPPDEPDSRFGLDAAAIERALEVCRAAGPTVRLEGFSFHLSGYEVGPRADLAAGLLRWCARAAEIGLEPDRISIGGGFAVDYAREQDWERFRAELGPEHFHANRRFGGFYPYHPTAAGPAMLRAILAATPQGEREPLAALLRAAGVRLLCEPGRALLDGAGVTVFTVVGIEDRGHHGILTVDGTSLSLSEQWFNSEFLPDPLLLPAPGRGPEGSPYAACVGGASCLEADMVTWRRVVFPVRPRPGDRLVYLNTAGYQMDSNESSFHELPLPPKVVVRWDGGRPRWQLDRAGGAS